MSEPVDRLLDALGPADAPPPPPAFLAAVARRRRQRRLAQAAAAGAGAALIAIGAVVATLAGSPQAPRPSPEVPPIQTPFIGAVQVAELPPSAAIVLTRLNQDRPPENLVLPVPVGAAADDTPILLGQRLNPEQVERWLAQ